MRKFLPLVLALMLIAPLSLVSSAVQGKDPIPVVITTRSVEKVGITDATLVGQVTTGDSCEVNVNFKYGTSPNDLNETTGVQNFDDCAGQLATHTFSAVISNLRPCTTYYYRAVLVSGVAKLPGHQFVAGFGFNPVSLPGLLNGSTTQGEVISFTTFCPSGSGPGNSGGGVGGMSPSLSPSIPPLFAVQSATVAAAKAAPGEQVEVTAMVTNKGGSNGTSKIVLYVNGQEADSKGIALSSGQSTPVSFKVSRNDPGTYQVSVNGVSAGSFTVDLFNSNDMLIYGSIALFAVGMIGLLYYLMKRRTVA